MKVSVFAAWKHSDMDWKDRVVVVIDTLRATSTIITAIANGCSVFIPVEEPSEAVELQRTLHHETVLLGGERNSQLIDGFSLSNSPLEYTRDVVSNKTIVFTTTNGTRAIRSAADAFQVLIGAYINVSAVAAQLVATKRDVTLLCAGTEGNFSTDDCVTAGAIIQALVDQHIMLELDDLSQACAILYRTYAPNLPESLKHTFHCKRLWGLGFEKDIRYCYQMNAVPTVPCYTDGVIRRLGGSS